MGGVASALGLTVTELDAAYRAGTREPVGLVGQTLAAITACHDPAVFTALTPDRALAEAEASALRRRAEAPHGPLDGVPVAWKDLFDLKGEITRAGSRVLDEGPAARDALLVQRLAEAGAVTVGKLNMTEFAYSGLGLNPHYGTPVNPWSRDEPRAPGGSSSASGVAVALGLVPVAIGTDTGGSVRIPAAFNGVVGYKSSGGRWPMAGGFPLSRTLDTAGVLCRSVADAALVDVAARGLTGAGPLRKSLDGLRLLVPTNVVWDGVEAAVVENAEAALQRLAGAGVRVERRPLPVFDAIVEMIARHGALAALEAYALHKVRLAGADVERMDRRVVARLRAGATIGAGSEAIIRAARSRLVREGAALFTDRTLVAFPTVPHTAPPIAALEADDALFAALNAKTLRNTLLGNVLDWCGLSIPSGLDANGLPTALLLSGAPGKDDDLFAIGLAAEPLIRGGRIPVMPPGSIAGPADRSARKD